MSACATAVHDKYQFVESVVDFCARFWDYSQSEALANGEHPSEQIINFFLFCKCVSDCLDYRLDLNRFKTSIFGFKIWLRVLIIFPFN